MNAHAIDITRCTECIFVGPHDPSSTQAACLHPQLQAIEHQVVQPFQAPPKACKLRELPVLLRVVS